jgi:hypothetical protein
MTNETNLNAEMYCNDCKREHFEFKCDYYKPATEPSPYGVNILDPKGEWRSYQKEEGQ